MPMHAMPSLREAQRAMRDSLIGFNADVAACYVVADGLAPEKRLAVYRNTFDTTLANALRVSYPAVRKLVGAEFFEGAATVFAHERPPRATWLDLYGAHFPEFLATFPPVASLPYLPDVARLEWAVNRALHALDIEPLDANAISAVDPTLHEHIRFTVDPSVSLLCTDYPAHTIWRAVLESDDATLTALDLADGPVHLLVQRLATGVEVNRIDEAAFRFTAALSAGQPLGEALACADHSSAATVLAEHLAAGRFIAFEVLPLPSEVRTSEIIA
jgi:hypothetical protein